MYEFRFSISDDDDDDSGGLDPVWLLVPMVTFDWIELLILGLVNIKDLNSEEFSLNPQNLAINQKCECNYHI